MIRHLGYACQNLTLGKNILSSRTIRLKNFTLERATNLAVKNSNDLITIMQWNAHHDIHFFRVGSGIFPFMDHPNVGYDIDTLPSKELSAIKKNLESVGNIAKKNNIRLSCHPGPYTCLASPDHNIVKKSILCLEMHSLLADLLGCGDEFAINIHVGGTYKDKTNTAKRFVKEFSKCSPGVQTRLTVENDDKASMWSMSDLYEILWPQCKTKYCNSLKLVLDVHHHRFCQRETLKQAAEMAFNTWPKDQIPKIHYSESRPNNRSQAHSDYIIGPIPDLGTTVYDVMIEAKSKELALLDYRQKSSSESVLSSSSV